MQSGSVLSGRTARPSVRCAGIKENVAALAAPTGVTRISFPQLSHEIVPMQVGNTMFGHAAHEVIPSIEWGASAVQARGIARGNAKRLSRVQQQDSQQ